MNIIRFLLYWFKARFGTLSIDDFCALCDAYEKSAHCKPSKMLLTVYFSSHTPNKDELDRIYASSFALRRLYLENIRRGRQLTPDEEHMLVCNMQIYSSLRFPARLRESALNELFSQNSPQKLICYVRDYALPPQYEMLLIARCQEHQTKVPYSTSYRPVLLSYLHNHQKCKFLTLDTQQAILELNDEEITIALIENCTLANNFLFLPVLQILVEKGSFRALQVLLLESFLPHEELIQIMLQRLPQLKYAYEISCLRRPLYRLEKETGEFWCVEAPSMTENAFIEQIVADEKENDAKERRKIAQQIILSMLEHEVTPYFCAWAAYKFPEIGEQAYKKMRQIAKFYYAKYTDKLL